MGEGIVENEIDGEEAGLPLHKRERIKVLQTPVDIIGPEELDLLLFSMARDGDDHSVVLLSTLDLLRARRNVEYREYLDRASIVLPISKSIVSGARFLHKKTATRYMPFDLVIRCLTLLGKHEFSCYLLGGRKKSLPKIEKNIADTFPGLRIVGRFPAPIKRREEHLLIEVIRKSAPSLLLVGKGARGGELWISRNSGRLGQGIKLWCSDLFEVLEGRKWRPKRKIFDLGLEWVGYCARNPLRLLRVFPLAYFGLLLLGEKALGKKGRGKN